MKAKELITKVLVGNPKTIVSFFAVMLLICGIQGIGYAAPEFTVTADEDGVKSATRMVPENQANTNVGEILEVTVDAGITLNNSHYNFRNIGRDFASFRLTAVEGGVRLVTRNALDYETQTDYEVIITVRDNIANNGGSRFAVDDEITVTIIVEDVSVADGDTAVVNSAPFFEGPRATRQVGEDAEKGENINSIVDGGDTPVAATDYTPNTTTSSGDTLTYGLQRGTDAASFDIDSMTGQLKAKAPLDYETKTSYMVIVTVTDGKNAADSVNPAVDDTIMVTIEVLNVNEPPMFPATIAPIEVAEDTVTGTNIGAPVVAMDVDSGDTLRYTRGGTDGASFDIDPATGQLRTVAALDYETQTDYEVMVIATDTGDGGGLTDTITVTINVTDVSELAEANREPAFNDGPSTTREVAENTAVKANIGDPVAARDVDRGDTLTYTLGGTDVASFDIDSTTGQLKISADLDPLFDFEVAEDAPPKTYMVTVTVKDGKDKDGTADPDDVDDTIRVTITVTDENEAPAFATPTAERSVAENTAAGASIGLLPVAAMDVDSGDTLTYTLGGTDAASFDIESTTGQLRTLAALDYETQTDYEVTVIATDKAGLTGEITVTIKVTNVSVDDPAVANSEPEFDDGPSTTRSVPENTPKGMNINTSGLPTDEDPVLARKAQDAADASAATTLTYGLLPGADAASFDIESTTGQLKTKAALDHETQKTYMVTVTVSDGKDAEENFAPAVDDTIRVTIMVTNVNEAPAFATKTATRSVSEDTVTDTNIGAPVVATDVDSDDTLTYMLGGTDEAFFAIESTTTGGQLQTKDALDYETQTDYEVTVIATDTGDGGGLTDTITVTIKVRDVSELAEANREPAFNDGPSTTREVAENTAVKANIGDPVAARDVDRGDTLTYTLGGTDVASFDIDSTTGQLKISADLDPLFDFEVAEDAPPKTYMVTVTVKDGKDKDGTADPDDVDDTIRVTITVTDENEAPAFATPTAERSVAENTAAGASIGLLPVAAMDVDSGDTLTYTLGGTDAASFDIESTTGQLRTLAALDYETQTDYEVTVIATDKAGLTGEITVTIKVTNVSVDDPAVANSEPEFDDGPSTTRSVPENTPKGMNINTSGLPTDEDPVLARKAQDAADASAATTLTYGLLPGADAASFDIESTTGQLKTKAALDHETQKTYMVTVTVSDGKDAEENFAPAVDDTIRVTIMVTNVNEAPVFPDTIAPIEVAEDTVTGTNIGAPVVATDVDSDDTLTYMLGGTDEAFFAIESTTTGGQLRTLAALDYETQTDYEVTVTATDTGDGGGLTDTITVTINVTDVSELAEANREPAFNDGPSTTREVAENTAVKANIGDPVAARDVDRGDTLTYTLGGTDVASFDIDSTTGQLKISADLDPLFDFEVAEDAPPKTYMVTVTVKDGKDKDGTADPDDVDDTIRVTITVTDENEAPAFATPTAERSVAENTAAGASIGLLPVAAMDVDSGDTLTYTLGGTDAASFDIESTTGQLRTLAALDYETQTDYEVTVIATDKAGLTGEITVTIKVTNVSVDDPAVANSEPEFDDGPSTTRSVPENTPKGMNINTSGLPTDEDPVLARKAQDAADASAATTLTYGLLPGADAASFDIESTTGQLKTKAALDHETQKTYMVTVTVSDGKDAEENFAPAVDDTIRVTIMVTNVNEAPVFPATIAPIVVAEDTAAGEDIGNPVVAMDVDKGDELTYMLDEPDASAFAIVETSGQLQTKDALDYETQTDYEVTVIATDTGDGGGLMDEITVTINVTDVSVANGDTAVANRAPAFNDGLRTTRSVRENTEAGEAIGAPVEATDPGDALTYTLSSVNDNDDAESFDIDTGSGQLKTKAPLDYETKTSYMVTVSVKDGKDVFSAAAPVEVDDTITVTIRVGNEVEDSDLVNRPPRFLMESIDLEVLENTAEDTNIGEPILAFDADTADSLTYGFDGDDAAKFTVNEGSNTALFTFNSETGQLKTNRAIPSYEVAPGYMVMLTVKDSKDEDGESDADEEADSEIDVTITVTDASDRPAFASDETGERSVAENTPAGMAIGDPFTATAADTDGEVTYTLGGADADSFDIDEETGQLKISDTLDPLFDFEAVPTKTSYMVTVTATTDDAEAPLAIDIDVTITVTDVNEAPAFASDAVTSLDVAENTPAGMAIGDPVEATDADTDDEVTYTLGGADAGLFDIGSMTGQLKTKDELDYEVVPAKTSYMVTVTATDDDAEAPLSDEISVTITVTDVNEAPAFASDETGERSVAENTPAAMAIGDPVEATDADTDDEVSYTLGGADAASFEIDSMTGQLKTLAELDYETQTDYEVTVTVTDDGTPAKSDEITVTIQVTDVLVADGDAEVTNRAPVFDDGTSTIREIAENTAAGESIGDAVAATDADSDDTLTYSHGGTDAASFGIDDTTGQLMTLAMLDHETKASYMVMVTADDGNGGTDTINVTISVTDVNEAPMFADETAESSVDENTAEDMAIGDPFAATDDDGDEVSYTLGGTDRASFAIDAMTGQLMTMAMLDHETKASYMVMVTATDTGGLTASITVTITVEDVNEAPMFADATAERSVAENTAAEMIIGDALMATDEDEGDEVMYSLGGTDMASFAIDAMTGQLKTLAMLDHETKDEYMVMVIATDTGGLTDTITVTISVMDINEAPMFADATAERSVAENTAAGEDIGAPVAVTDDDMGTTLTYSLGGTDAASFDIDATTGQLQTKVALDHETKTDYEVTVSVSDGSLMDEITVTIDVTDVSVDDGDTAVTNSAPVFDDGPSTTRSVDENTAAGEAIGDAVAATDADSGDTLTYSLGGTDAASFDIDDTTGQLMTLAMLDHETKASYMVMVTADDGNGGTDTINVTISVTDVNEAPMFASETAERSVAENTAAEMIIGDPFTATDDDGDEVMYSLGGTDMASFAIDEMTGELKTLAMLDHETKDEYMVMVIATDTGGLMGSIMVTITVTDVNEAPMFASETAESSVAENTAADMMIGDALMATDEDDGDEVTYTLGGTDMASFAIDAMTGQLKTLAMLDHETKDEYMVMVIATDTGGLTGSIMVTITVTDVSEAPMFASETAESSVAENTAAEMMIGDPFTATDDDGDEVMYSLGGTDMASFDIDATTGQLQTKVALDFETKTDYEVTVIATDTDGETDTITVTIDVTDVLVADGDTAVTNSAPVFDDGTSTTRSVDENTDAGESIGDAVAATDADSGDTLTYSHDGTDAASFDIDDTTGQLMTLAMLDHETKASYMVMVTADDGNGGTDTINVTISVTDVNEAPMFASETAESSVAENTAAEMIIGDALMATDEDDGDELTYTLGGTDMASFAIDSATGQLKTMAMLDHETKDEYMVMVIATDTDGLTDSITVTITVTDVNDAPMFADATAERSVAENTAAEMIIGDALMATDEDDGDEVSYSLGGTDMASFAIDAMTGELKTLAMLDHETKDEYTVMVIATDTGGLTDTITVTITVTATGANTPPVFASGTAARSIAENTAAGTNIGAPVTATDSDTGDVLTYTLGGTDAGSFTITSGQLRTQAALNYETKNSYTVVVTATDQGGLTDSITVTITVTDVDETTGGQQPGGTVIVTPPRATPGTTNNAPTFADGASTTREVAENTPAGQNIGSPVSATDPNGDTLTYALGGTDAASFDINTATGQLMTKVALDYETQSSYSVAVDAKDASITTSITVTINVTDVAVEDTPITDNVAPAFASETAARSIAENTAAGGNIGTPVTATDSNTGDVLTYTLGGTDMASFDINAASGQLMTQAMLDHETKASYMVMVTATDKAGLTDSITVTITVTNVNEAPMFADETATRMVDENTAADMMIGDALMATDPDDGDEVMYSLGGDDMGSFAIDAATGQLMTMAMLDHETKASYMVMVTATDKAGLTGSIMVTISVTDVNDAPMFASATAERMVAENTAAGMMIGAPLTAMDDDGDEVMYTVGGDDMESFAIDAATGQLKTMAALDHETKASYMVMVTASDGTDMSSITVTIMVTDVPEFMLRVPAGQSLIHIPLKMANLAKISDLHEKLGGKSKVSNLITRDAAKDRWYSYLGPESQARVGDRDLTDDLGILAVMKEEVTIQLSGDPLGTDGVSSIMLQAGTNLVGVPLKDKRITNVIDLLELEGIKDNVSYIIVSDGREYRTVTRARDPGDVAVTGGQSFILQATEAATVMIAGDGWASSAATAAPSWISRMGIRKEGVTAALAVTGSIVDEVKGLTDFHITVKNLSTGKVGTVATSDDGVGYQLTFVDIKTGRAAQIGDHLEITARSADPLVGVDPLRHVVTAEDVKRGHIQLDTLVTYEIPAKTELLRNYPNPFNPETWIPYRLAKDATVTLEIYDTTGGIVRNIHIGHQLAAIYESRSKAIYWDGRNEFGERVASGIYFYHLTAGDYSATRKMVILK